MNMTALEKEKKYTADEFLAMADLKGSYELIDGVIYDMSPSPNQNHQRMIGRFFSAIDKYITDHKGKCEVLIAPSDVKIDDQNIVQPDIFIVCDPDKLDGQTCNGAPDWVIEILSPSNERHDTIDKLYKYSAAGVREYWIVDPMEERVIVYLLEAAKITGLYTFDDNIPVGIYKDAPEPLNICINKLMNK